MSLKVDRKGLRSVSFLVISVCGVVLLFPILGLRINLTSSHVPVGLWRAYPADSVSVGDVITFDVYDLFFESPQVYDERMKFDSSKLLKKVAALPGAVIERSGDLVIIDGKELQGAKIMKNSWCRVEYPLVVPDGAVWLMADSETAFDSRYHGPLPVRLIREKNKPVLVWRRGAN
ncbi:MAG: S26 family signal peptidase [Synergistaceae bacterium]|jgi:type IV secretory pathway protease TraF|nr:S26 family signal peptidase [Synergistaceae bacterium]